MLQLKKLTNKYKNFWNKLGKKKMHQLQNFSKKNKFYNNLKKYKINTKPKSSHSQESPTKFKMILRKYKIQPASLEVKYTPWTLK